MALRALWRKLTGRRAKDGQIDLRPERDRLRAPNDGIVNTPPKAPGLEKPKY